MKIPFPMTIGKQSSPYMYRAERTGIMINNYPFDNVDYGIKIPVNKDANENYYMLSLQLWIKAPVAFTADAGILTIETNSGTINLDYLMNTENRAIVVCDAPVDIYQNGVKTSSPILVPMVWTSIYIAFKTAVSFSSFTGNIILKPGMLFDNISEYIYENEIEEDSRTVRYKWAQVYTPDFGAPTVHNTWGDIKAKGSWKDATTTTVTINDYFIDGSYLYNDQTGSSVVVIEDDASVGIFSSGTDIFTNVEWITIERPLV